MEAARKRTHMQVLGKLTDLVDNQYRMRVNAPFIVRETHLPDGRPIEVAYPRAFTMPTFSTPAPRASPAKLDRCAVAVGWPPVVMWTSLSQMTSARYGMSMYARAKGIPEKQKTRTIGKRRLGLGTNPGVVGFVVLALGRWMTGFPEQAGNPFHRRAS